MNKRDEYSGPRIGLYYGIVIDQNKLAKKIQPIDVASVVERITKISPFDAKAVWKLDYDHSQCYSTIVIYHSGYTKINPCPGYIGCWGPNGSTITVSKDVSAMADMISYDIEDYLQPNITETSTGLMGIGYCVVYFIA